MPFWVRVTPVTFAPHKRTRKRRWCGIHAQIFPRGVALSARGLASAYIAIAKSLALTGSVCILLCYFTCHAVLGEGNAHSPHPQATLVRNGVRERPMLRNRLTFFLLSAVHQLRRPGVPSLRQADGARPPPRQLAEPTTGSRVEVVATAAAPTLRRPRCLGLRQAAAP